MGRSIICDRCNNGNTSAPQNIPSSQLQTSETPSSQPVFQPISLHELSRSWQVLNQHIIVTPTPQTAAPAQSILSLPLTTSRPSDATHAPSQKFIVPSASTGLNQNNNSSITFNDKLEKGLDVHVATPIPQSRTQSAQSVPLTTSRPLDVTDAHSQTTTDPSASTDIDQESSITVIFDDKVEKELDAPVITSRPQSRTQSSLPLATSRPSSATDARSQTSVSSASTDLDQENRNSSSTKLDDKAKKELDVHFDTLRPHSRTPSVQSVSLTESSPFSDTTPTHSRSVTVPSPLPHGPTGPDQEKRESSIIFNDKVKKELDVEMAHVLSHRKRIRCVKFSQDGKRLAAACKDGRAYVYDVQTGTLTW